MPSRFQSRGWKICRKVFRGIRILALLLILGLLAAAIYLNQIGLPDWLKRPVLDKLHEKGVDLQFSRLRLRWYRGIVAEDVVFGNARQSTNSPQLSIDEVAVKLNHEALKRFEINVDSLILYGGELTVPIEGTNQVDGPLIVKDIQTHLRFLPNDEWQLDKFKASFAGANVQLSGSLTNASYVRQWPIFQGKKGPPSRRTERNLDRLADVIKRINFSAPPELKLSINGDARKLESFAVDLNLTAPGADTPWGTLTNGQLALHLAPPDNTNQQPRAEFRLRADEAVTQWASTKKLQLDVHAVSESVSTNILECQLELTAGEFTTRWAQANDARFVAQWTHSLTNPVPLSGSGELILTNAHTRWGDADAIQLTGQLATPAKEGPRLADESWAWWATLEPYNIDWNCKVQNLHAQDFKIQEIACGGAWRSPDLVVTNLYSELYQGKLNASASVNVASRELSFDCSSSFDVQKAAPVLTPKSRQWISQFSWRKPPLLHGHGELILPAWTNQHPDWRTEVAPTLKLNGEVELAECSFRGVPVSSAKSHFAYSNLVWNVPDLAATRPEGRLDVQLRANDRTRDYYFQVHSTIDPKVVRPLFDPKQQQVFDMVSLEHPPRIDAEIWGRWYDYDRTGIRANVACSNFTFRGQSGTGFQTSLEYTNHVLVLTNARVDRVGQYGSASSAVFNFDRKTVAITNGFSNMDPAAVMSTVGPKVSKIMEPYHFSKPPQVRINGILPLASDAPVDVHFDVEGGPFHWNKFNVPHISGKVAWMGDHLSISQVQADFYDGILTGTSAFDFSEKHGAVFSFDIIATDANLHSLMADLHPGTNHLEGKLNAHLNITSANTADMNSWFGQGQVDLRNGLIWEIPIFGIFSQPLNDFIPGLGKSPVNEASGTFRIENSVIRSDNLEMRAPTMRMQYKGSVDFEGRVDATVEAELLRDTWLVGRFLSAAFWPITKAFEYKVTGTLSNPITQPLYVVPRMLLKPFHPLRSFKEMLMPGNGADTNSPAPFKEPPPAQ